jgi:hypothetical protein
MKIRLYLTLTCLLTLLAFCRCSGSAEIERKQAQKALEQAKIYHADNLAPTDFEKAQIAWDHAQAAEKDGRTGNAKVLFTSAKIFFEKAADIAKSKRDALSRELDLMQGMIGKNFGQVKIDLSMKPLSPNQRSQVAAIVSEVEKDNASINKLVAEDDLTNAVAMAKEVQTKIYHAQLILAGRKIR